MSLLGKIWRALQRFAGLVEKAERVERVLTPRPPPIPEVEVTSPRAITSRPPPIPPKR